MIPSNLYKHAVTLLETLIECPSFSKEENHTAAALEAFFSAQGIPSQRYLNNVWAVNQFFDPAKPSILLNSHHDTVKPNPQYTKNPFEAVINEGKLYGLGSNDAGGPLVALIAAFMHFYAQPHLSHNLLIAATAEEEISGVNGIEALLQHTSFIEDTGAGITGAIVGEPTQMQLAVAEKGLLVLDVVAYGKAGHAAREEGENAIYKAMQDIAWFENYQFPQQSPTLGPVKMSVTVIQTENKAHNVVPAECRFVVDIRVTDAYSHEAVLEIVQQHVKSKVTPRSLRMRATSIDSNHPLVKAGIALGKHVYGSPTCSDKALMPFPALKCGPGDSARSHTADEYIYLQELEAGIHDYIEILNKVLIV